MSTECKRSSAVLHAIFATLGLCTGASAAAADQPNLRVTIDWTKVVAVSVVTLANECTDPRMRRS